MTLFGKVLFIATCLYGIVGVCLLYDGMGRMKESCVPPFNEGLYAAVWMIPSPPSEVVRWCDTILGRLIVIGSGFLFAGSGAHLAMRYQLYQISFLLVVSWSVFVGCFGIWTWIFSVFT